MSLRIVGYAHTTYTASKAGIPLAPAGEWAVIEEPTHLHPANLTAHLSRRACSRLFSAMLRISFGDLEASLFRLIRPPGDGLGLDSWAAAKLSGSALADPAKFDGVRNVRLVADAGL